VVVNCCRKCNTHIRGYYHDNDILFIGGYHYKPPAFCTKCGAAFPWTERRLKTAHQLIQEQRKLSKKEKEIFEQSFDDLIHDTPNAMVAADRIKSLLIKVSKTAAEALRQLIVDVASETISKSIRG